MEEGVFDITVLLPAFTTAPGAATITVLVSFAVAVLVVQFV